MAEITADVMSEAFYRQVQIVRDLRGCSLTEAVAQMDAMVKVASDARKKSNARGLAYEKAWSAIKDELEEQVIEEIASLGDTTDSGNPILQHFMGSSWVKARKGWSARVTDVKGAAEELVARVGLDEALKREYVQIRYELTPEGRKQMEQVAIEATAKHGEVVPWAAVTPPGHAVVHRVDRPVEHMTPDPVIDRSIRRVRGEVAARLIGADRDDSETTDE